MPNKYKYSFLAIVLISIILSFLIYGDIAYAIGLAFVPALLGWWFLRKARNQSASIQRNKVIALGVLAGVLLIPQLQNAHRDVEKNFQQSCTHNTFSSTLSPELAQKYCTCVFEREDTAIFVASIKGGSRMALGISEDENSKQYLGSKLSLAGTECIKSLGIQQPQ